MTVIALGTFDGVHLGHREIIKAAVKYAKKHGMINADQAIEKILEEI